MGDLAQRVKLVAGAGFWSTAAGDGIRSIVLSDGPHGLRLQPQGGDALGLGESVPATCFPPAAGIASSWDPDLMERVGAALGAEAASHGVGVLLGPGVNIKRSPLCGRNFEYFSEDPLLSGALGAAWVRGIQSQGVGASLKHFAVNNQETNRMTVSAVVDERTLREIYLPAFEHVVTTAKPWTVMCSYNRINGVYAAENAWLLQDVLRDEWGFDGLVVSDWGAVDDRVAALAAGTDLEMPGPSRHSEDALVAAGADVEPAIKRLRRLVHRVGTPEGSFSPDAHHALAREAARASIVLLRNEGGVLPLAPGVRLAVIGEFAREPRFQGAGSSQVSPTRVDAALDFLRERAEVTYAAGGPEAVAAARSAEVALLFVGLPAGDESEGYDRAHLDLPADQVALIRAVAAAQPNTVVVLTNGGVVSLEPWHDEVAGVVETWLLGQAGGSALVDVLFGDVDASGRLAESIPFRLQDTPSYLHFPGDAHEVRYSEGMYVGYRHFESADVAVRHPFGFGLSYTTFAWTQAHAHAHTASVLVTNTGKRTGVEVVQVYVTPSPDGPRSPVRALAGFARVTLAPGESRRVEIRLAARAFQHWDVVEHRWRRAGGAYEVQFGRDAHRIAARVTVRFMADAEATRLTFESTVQQWLEHPVTGPLLRWGASRAAEGAPIEGGANVLDMVGSMPMSRLLRFPGVDIPRAPLRVLLALANVPPVRALAASARKFMHRRGSNSGARDQK